MILESSISRSREHFDCTSLLSSPNKSSFSSTNADCQVPDNILAMARRQEAELTQRELVTVIALGMIMSQLPPSKHDTLDASALLLHTAILSECRLAERATAPKQSQTGEAFLESYANAVVNVLTSRSWREFSAQTPCRCDLGDLVDGNLFLGTLNILERTKGIDSFSAVILKKFEMLKMAVSDMLGTEILSGTVGPERSVPYSYDTPSLQSAGVGGARRKKKEADVLPFSNPVIDAHLQPVSVVTVNYADEDISPSTSRIFQELSHWHNHKRRLNSRPDPQITPKQKMFLLRRNQYFMSDVRRYAASLTNAVGGSLEPETVCVKPREAELLKKSKGSKAKEEKTRTSDHAIHRGSASSGHKKGGKHGKESVRDKIAANQQFKQNEAAERHFSVWRTMIQNFESEHDYATRYIQVKQYLERLPSDKRRVVEVEILAYMTSILVLMWKEKCNTRCRDSYRDSSMPIAALIWHTIQQVAKAKSGVTDDIAQCLRNTLRAINLPNLDLPRHGKRRMTFTFAELDPKAAKLGVDLSPSDFQLIHAGPYMDRSMGSTRDPRIHDFEPDRWQREVLDQIDARGSLFVVAPTSAGKTFIS